ncbi:N-acetyllactosaminide 3-alpha-galactosyltransferase, partial [Ostertagia ostertagi]
AFSSVLGKDLAKETTAVVKQMFQNVSFKDSRLEVLEYLIVPQVGFCNGSLFVVIVPVRVDDHIRRTEWRSSYASSSFKHTYMYSVLFAVGLSRSEEIQRKLLLENELYGDLLQADFEDVYHNLTRKVLSALRFVYHSCRQAKAIVKVDDDVGWNIKQAKDFVLHHLDNHRIYGLRDANNKPERTNAYEQWKLTEEEWNKTYFPPFCRGLAYVIPTEAAGKLLSVTPSQQFLKLEDVFVTGVLSEAANITVTHLGGDRITLAKRDPRIHKKVDFTFFKIDKINSDMFSEDAESTPL